MEILKRFTYKYYLPVLIMALLFPAHMKAQQVVSPGGGFFATGSMTLSFTLGEPVTGTLMAGDKALTQGFQQPSRIATLVPYERIESASVRVFPNPFATFVEVEVQDAGGKPWQVEVLDLRGTRILVECFLNTQGRLDLSGLSPGCYFVRVFQTGRGYLCSVKMIRH